MARNNIPTALIDAEVFIDGSNDMAGVGEVELPKVEYKTVEVEQIGMNAGYEAPLIGHFEKMDCKIKMDCIDESVTGLNNGSSLLLEIKGVLQSEGISSRGTNIKGVDVTINGQIKSIEIGKIKPGEKFEATLELSVSYYKLKIDNNDIVEIDVFKRISNVNGSTNDTIRKLLGLV